MRLLFENETFEEPDVADSEDVLDVAVLLWPECGRIQMSLAAGPGRGRSTPGQLPDEVRLVVDKHVAYIQSLDTVRNYYLSYLTALARADVHREVAPE